MFDNNISLINLKGITKNDKNDIIVIIGDITQDDYVSIKLKTTNSYILIFNDKPILLSNKLKTSNFIYAKNNLIEITNNIIYNLLGKGIINLSTDDIKKYINGDCIAILESGNNVEAVIENLCKKLKEYNIEDSYIVNINGNDNIGIAEIEKITGTISSKINQNSNIILSVNNNLVEKGYQIIVIAKLK